MQDISSMQLPIPYADKETLLAQQRIAIEQPKAVRLRPAVARGL